MCKLTTSGPRPATPGTIRSRSIDDDGGGGGGGGGGGVWDRCPVAYQPIKDWLKGQFPQHSPTVTNIVGTVALGCGVCLDRLLKEFEESCRTGEGEAATEQGNNRCVQYKQRFQRGSGSVTKGICKKEKENRVTPRIFRTRKIVRPQRAYRIRPAHLSRKVA